MKRFSGWLLMGATTAMCVSASIAQDRNQRTPGRPIGLTPLTDLAGRYKGEDGGLYGGGLNAPPARHLGSALRAASMIQPLDSNGHPSTTGRIVLVSIGMSNTTQEFRRFMALTSRDEARSPAVVVVDGAQGGMDAAAWLDPDRKNRRTNQTTWEFLEAQLERAGVTPRQVQVAWIKQATAGPHREGEFPGHAQKLARRLGEIVGRAKQRCANLRLAYLSSRIYAGYATSRLNPEPYAYESAFSVRWLIQRQIRGDKALNFDPDRGVVRAPVILWGPYLWADGEKGRAVDDLTWSRDDLAGDGTHPSDSGRQKVAGLLLTFFKNDPTAKPWFTRTTPTPERHRD